MSTVADVLPGDSFHIPGELNRSKQKVYNTVSKREACLTEPANIHLTVNGGINWCIPSAQPVEL